MTEIELYWEATQPETYNRAINDLIRYCRRLQEEDEIAVVYENISGEKFLYEMVQNGALKLSVYLSILPAVIDYKTPYTLNLIDEK